MTQQATDQDRVGSYVQRFLPRLLAEVWIEWSLAVEWDDARIVARITRGELVVTARERRYQWWVPASKAHAQRLARELFELLHRWAQRFPGVDETGRCRTSLWRTAEGLGFEGQEGATVVPAVLEPGVYLGERSGGGTPLVYRHGEDAGATLPDAVGMGWVRVSQEREA